MVSQRFRIRFRKEGDLQLISHRDLVRTLERLFRRANLALRMSEGFHPKPRMSFPLALSLGIRGDDEVMELELTEELSAAELADRLTAHAIGGLSIIDVRLVPPGGGKAQVQGVRYELAIPPDRQPQVAAAIERLLAAASYPIQRSGKDRTIDIRAGLVSLALEEGRLRMQLRVSRGADVHPRDVLTALGADDLEHAGEGLARTAVELIP